MNKYAPEAECHDPAALLGKYKTLLGQMEDPENREWSELRAALAHHLYTGKRLA